MWRTVQKLCLRSTIPNLTGKRTSSTAVQITPGCHPSLAYGVPRVGDSDILVKPGFVLGYDRMMRNPRWVTEKLTEESVHHGRASRRNVRFYEERAITVEHRAKLSDYRRSGYDRGHMAAAGNHKTSMAHIRSTFTLANAVPQVGRGFNQGYWARIEQWARRLTLSHSSVFLVTGPLYMGSEVRRIGRSRGVAIPTHLFKSILVTCSTDGTPSHCTTLLLPNEKIHNRTPISLFTVDRREIEQEAGIELFPLISQHHIDCLLDREETQW